MKRFVDYKCRQCGVIEEHFEHPEINLPTHCDCGGIRTKVLFYSNNAIIKAHVMSKKERKERWNSPDPRVKV